MAKAIESIVSYKVTGMIASGEICPCCFNTKIFILLHSTFKIHQHCIIRRHLLLLYYRNMTEVSLETVIPQGHPYPCTIPKLTVAFSERGYLHTPCRVSLPITVRITQVLTTWNGPNSKWERQLTEHVAKFSAFWK